MFHKLLIANRGEIACRIARTARRLGIATVAVYSEADAGALHVDLADEAWPIGPAPARHSYLCIDKLIETALRSGAQAVHPGYGFLAENPEFAEQCMEAGLIFIGPSAQAMRLMGSKSSAKALMERAEVPTVPGYHGDAVDAASLMDAAKRVGFPLLVKASAGGGGRECGSFVMRVNLRPQLPPLNARRWRRLATGACCSKNILRGQDMSKSKFLQTLKATSFPSLSAIVQCSVITRKYWRKLQRLGCV